MGVFANINSNILWIPKLNQFEKEQKKKMHLSWMLACRGKKHTPKSQTIHECYRKNSNISKMYWLRTKHKISNSGHCELNEISSMWICRITYISLKSQPFCICRRKLDSLAYLSYSFSYGLMRKYIHCSMNHGQELSVGVYLLHC